MSFAFKDMYECNDTNFYFSNTLKCNVQHSTSFILHDGNVTKYIAREGVQAKSKIKHVVAVEERREGNKQQLLLQRL